MDNNTEKKQDTIASLFSDGELKDLFKKFLVLIGGIEVFIFFACWIYQLGINEFDRFGPVNIPFPWKIYFTVAFLAPIAVIFLLGLFVVAFNRYIYGTRPTPNGEPNAEGKGGRKITGFMNEMLQLPFLFSLLLLGTGVLVIYRINDIAGFVARLGVESFQFFRILSFVGIGILTIFGLVWMVMKYRLREKEMDYQYKETVMKQLGVLVEDGKSVVQLQDLLPPPATSADAGTVDVQPDLETETSAGSSGKSPVKAAGGDEVTGTANVDEIVDTVDVAEVDDTAEAVDAVDAAEVVDAVEVAEVVDAVEVAEVVDALEVAEVVDAVEVAEVVDALEVAEVADAVEVAELVDTGNGKEKNTGNDGFDPISVDSGEANVVTELHGRISTDDAPIRAKG